MARLSNRRGQRPLREFLDGLTDVDAAAILAGMIEVKREGLRAARHLRGDMYEVRSDGERVSYRLLFAVEGRHGEVLLALEAFVKKTQKTPERMIRLAERRLADWRSRGRRTARTRNK